MAEKKPSPVTLHEYDIPSMNTLFAWSSALLLGVSLWMIWDDYDREWKDYQRRYNDIEIARTSAAIETEDKKISKKALKKVQTKLDAATAALDGKQGEVDTLEDELQGMLGHWYNADQGYKFIKAELDVARFEVNEARLHDHGLAGAQEKFDGIVAEVEENRLAFEEVDTKKQQVEAKISALRKDFDDADKEMKSLYGEKTRLEKILAKIDHSLVKDYFRDRPLVDFLAPTIKVKQAVLPDIHTDVNFMTVPRVDRCQSCHLSINKPGWTEDSLPPEFRTHSNPDLITKNHPIERFGCTGCHEGGGLSITFGDAAHAPNSDEQAHEWEEKYHWHQLHYWDFPQVPRKFVEGTCANCHLEQSRVPGADKLNEGRELIEKLGCHGCHKIDRPGYTELRKVGPDLARIRGKVNADWLYKWIEQPKAFRPTTKMPRIWGNENTSKAVENGMNYPLRDKIEINSVAKYLLANTSDYGDLPKMTRAGDPVRGKWVVENRGCKGCHVVGSDDDGAGRYRDASHGPELNQVGSKLTTDWIYAWIKDPKSMWADTRMPDLRLDDTDAADAAAYLSTLKNPEFDNSSVPDLSTAEAQQMLSDVTFEYLRKETTTADATKRLDGMGEDERYAYLGEKLVGRQGCFGCHPGVPGFENAQPIGTELTTWASKLLTQLDFGLQKIDHNKHTWLREKLLNPRLYDRGKVESKHPQDLLRMPNFELERDEVELIMTTVLGFRRNTNQLGVQRHLDPRETAIEQGRRLVEQYNCRGCHLLEDLGGGLDKVLEGGEPFSPPVLVASFTTPDERVGETRQGAKVNPEWFFDFLKVPSTIRPWLHVRMPTFGMTDEDATAIVLYFSEMADQKFPYDSMSRDDLDPALVAEGKQLFDKFQCINCHLPLEEAKRRGVKPEELAPNLELAKSRLKFDWIASWLKDPGFIQKNTRMPSYFHLYDEDEEAYIDLQPDAGKKIEALRAYLMFHGDALPTRRMAANR